MPSRRTILLSASIGSIGYLSAVHAKPPSNEWDKRLSHALLEEASSEFVAAWGKRRVSSLTTEDLRAVTVSAKILFSHLDEIGWTAATEKDILSDPSRVLNYEPTKELVLLMKRTLETQGAIVSTKDVEGLFHLSIEGKERGLKRIREGGLRASQRDALAFLHRQIVRSRSSQTVAYRRVALQDVPLAAQCEQMQAVIDATFLSAALNGLACAILCVPCCGIAAGLGVLGALLQSEKNTACSGLNQ